MTDFEKGKLWFGRFVDDTELPFCDDYRAFCRGAIWAGRINSQSRELLEQLKEELLKLKISSMITSTVPYGIGYCLQIMKQHLASLYERTFHDILELTEVEGSRGGTHIWWRGTDNTKYLMYGRHFNAMLKNKETQWVGPLLIDGKWQVILMHKRECIKPIHPSDENS